MEKKDSPSPLLSIVIPAYNEERRIGATLKRIITHLKSKKFSWDLFVVNDGSTDATVDVVKKILKECNPPVENSVIDFKENRGKGFAVRNGVLRATGNFVIFLDADSSTPIEELDKFLPFFDSPHEILIGTRKVRDHNTHVEAPFLRKTMGMAYSRITSYFLSLKVSDITCGFKCFKSHTIKPIFTRQLLTGWGFDAEILFLARKLNFKIKEIPINWTHHREDSKVKIIKNILPCSLELLRIRKNSLLGHYNSSLKKDL